MSWKNKKHLSKIPEGWQLCSLCGHPEKSHLHFEPVPVGWNPIELAPKTAIEVEILTVGGETLVAHYAQDLSGSDQPPFRGWFRSISHSETGKFMYYSQILPAPIAWRWIENKKKEKPKYEVING